jgi:hypothetical protein
MGDGVSWSHGVGDSWGVRVLLYVGGGVPLGVAIVAAALLGRVGVLAARADRYGVVSAVAFVFLAGGVFARRGAVAGVTADVTPDLRVERLRVTWLVVASLAGAGLVVVAAWAGPVWFFGAVFAGIGLPLATAGLFTSEGRVDLDNRILYYDDAAFVLDELSNVRRFSIGNVVLLLCRFVPGTGRTPTLLVLPADVELDAREAFDRGAEADVDLGGVDRPTRVVTGLFAGLLASLAVASVAVLWATPLIAIYVGGSLGLLGVFVFVLGWVGP